MTMQLLADLSLTTLLIRCYPNGIYAIYRINDYYISKLSKIQKRIEYSINWVLLSFSSFNSLKIMIISFMIELQS
jgi:hypothetical protein